MKIYDTNYVSKILGLSPQMVGYKVQQKKLKCLGITNRKRYYTMEHINDFILNHDFKNKESRLIDLHKKKPDLSNEDLAERLGYKIGYVDFILYKKKHEKKEPIYIIDSLDLPNTYFVINRLNEIKITVTNNKVNEVINSQEIRDKLISYGFIL